jgi:hypothetical protein
MYAGRRFAASPNPSPETRYQGHVARSRPIRPTVAARSAGKSDSGKLKWSRQKR